MFDPSRPPAAATPHLRIAPSFCSLPNLERSRKLAAAWSSINVRTTFKLSVTFRTPCVPCVLDACCPAPASCRPAKDRREPSLSLILTRSGYNPLGVTSFQEHPHAQETFQRPERKRSPRARHSAGR